MTEYGIVANVIESDKVFRVGDKCWLAGGTGGEGWSRFVWIANKGRMIERWVPTHRFDNFRAAWVPEHLRNQVYYMRGTREEMESRARELCEFADKEREAHPNRAVGNTRGKAVSEQ